MSNRQFSNRRGQGRGIAFLRDLIGHTGTLCVRWPLACDRHGYGQLGFNGKLLRAHRIMCELAHGPAPSPKHEVAHLCGNGHNACINPNHLRWKLHEENMADLRLHGRHNRNGQRRKLTDDQVREIRALKGSMTYKQIAERYGVHHRTVGLIATGQDRPDRPKRHRGSRYPEPQRSMMVMRAKELRATGMSYYAIGKEIGCNRNTAKTLFKS